MEQNEDIRFNSLIPELSVSNIEKSKAFYKKPSKKFNNFYVLYLQLYGL